MNSVCKAADVHFIDDDILHGYLEGLIALPVIILTNELTPMNELSVCVRLPAPDRSARN